MDANRNRRPRAARKLRYPILSLALALGAASAGAENLVPAGHFDRAEEVTAWRVDGPSGVEAVMEHDAALDAATCDGSGSAAMRTSGSGTFTAYYEICAGAVEAGEQYSLALAVLHSGNGASGALYWGPAWFEGPDCTGWEVASASIGPIGESPHWQPMVMTSSVPDGAASVLVRVELDYANAPDPLTLHLDRVVVRRLDEVFDDGFEKGGLCHWGAPET
jgi:hypothetical protein